MGRVGADPKLVGAEDRQVVMFNVAVNILHRAPADETPDPESNCLCFNEYIYNHIFIVFSC